MLRLLRPVIRAIALPLVLTAVPMAFAQAQRRSLLLSETPAPPGRRCEVAKRPRALPALSAVLDSAALHQALAADSALKAAPGSVLLSLRFDESGALVWARAIEGDLTESAKADVQRIVQRFARAGQRQDQPWSVRLRVRTGPTRELRLGRSEICPIAQAAGGAVHGMESVRGQELAEMNRATESRIQVRVSPEGQVLDIRLLQSSGSRIMDDMALRSARGSRYLPELVDGIGVEGRHEIRSRRSR